MAALWAVALSAVFFNYRGEDVGRLPALLASFPGPFRGFSGTALRDSILGGVITVLVVLSWTGFGDWLAAFIGSTRSGRFPMPRRGAGLPSVLGRWDQLTFMVFSGIGPTLYRAVASGCCWPVCFRS